MKPLDDLIRDTIRQALGIVRNVDAVDAVRERAAEITASLLHDLGDHVTEADLADMMGAAAAAIGVGRHTARTLAAAVLHADSDREKAPAAVCRLAARAFEHGHHRAACDCTILLLRAGHPVPDEWAARSVECAFEERRRARGVSVVRAWLDCPLPADAGWLVAAVECRGEQILGYFMIREDHLRAIQIVVPTVVGWLELLKRADEVDRIPISARALGANLDRGRQALEQAMEQTTPGGRVTLASWLVQLASDGANATEAAGA